MPRNRGPRGARLVSWGVGLLALSALLGCGGNGGSSSAGVDHNEPTTSAAAPSLAPGATDAPTPGPTPTENATRAPLPIAEIVTADATIVGDLGTYTIDGQGSDAPWLPFNSLPSITAGVSDTLAIRFSDGVVIGDWSAVIAGALDTSGSTTRGVDGALSATDGTTASVGPLPLGRWVLQVRLFRADGRGDGLTYWAVTVR